MADVKTLDFALIAALVAAKLLLVRMHRKQMILRHLFIHSSDWCARKIHQMADSAI